MTFNCIIGETEFTKFCPSSYPASLEDECPFKFYPKESIVVVDARKGNDKIDLIFPGRTTVPDLVTLEKLISTIKDSALFLVDWKKNSYVLDLEHDVAHSWFTEPNRGYGDCLVFSGDGERHMIYNCYTQAKLAAWGLNIIGEFDLTSITNEGRDLVIDWVEKAMGERLIHATKEILIRYVAGYSGIDTGDYYSAFNFSKLKNLVKKVKVPASSQPPYLLPAGPSHEDVVIINGEVPVSCIISMQGFDFLKGLTISFDIPLAPDLLSAAIDSLGNIVFRQTLGGPTTALEIAEDLQIPVEKILLVQYHLKGD